MSTLSLRTKLVSAACATALTMSVPAMAFAAVSPSNTSTYTSNDVTITVTVASGSVSVTESTTPASNVPSGSDVITTFSLTPTDVAPEDKVELTFSAPDHKGETVTVYIQNSDGTTETQTVTVGSDGSLVVKVSGKAQLVTLSHAAAGTTGAATTTAGTNKSATSPQTGVSLLAVSVATGAMAVAAGGTGVALRKKVRG